MLSFFKAASILILSIIFTACASIHDGNYATPENKNSDHKSASGIIISGAENADLSSEYFGIVDFTFENKTADWIRIKNVSLDFGFPETNAAVKIPVGNDLLAWAKAAEQNKQIRDYNTNLVLGSVLALGAVATVAGKDPGIRNAGALTMLGAAGGLTVMSIRDEKSKIELAKLVPQSHLMSDDFVIPPGLHTKKWIAFYTKNPADLPRITSAVVTYTLDNGKTEKAVLKFRAVGSKWQPKYKEIKSH